MLKKFSAKSYIILAIILVLFVSAKIFRYYKLPRSKIISNVKMETFSLQKQWEHIKKTASITGDVRVDLFSLDSSDDNKKCKLLLVLYEKKETGPLHTIFLSSSGGGITKSSPLGDLIKITIFPPQSRYSVNTEEYISMDDFAKIFDNLQGNMNTLFKTTLKEYNVELFPDIKEFDKIEPYLNKTYYMDKKKNNIRMLKKEDLPLHNTVSIFCEKSINHSLDDMVRVVVDNIQ